MGGRKGQGQRTVHVFRHHGARGQSGPRSGHRLTPVGDVNERVFKRILGGTDDAVVGERVVEVPLAHLLTDPLQAAGEEDREDRGFTCEGSERVSRRGGGRRGVLMNLTWPTASQTSPPSLSGDRLLATFHTYSSRFAPGAGGWVRPHSGSTGSSRVSRCCLTARSTRPSRRSRSDLAHVSRHGHINRQ